MKRMNGCRTPEEDRLPGFGATASENRKNTIAIMFILAPSVFIMYNVFYCLSGVKYLHLGAEKEYLEWI